jgi:hypothetical protein
MDGAIIIAEQLQENGLLKDVQSIGQNNQHFAFHWRCHDWKGTARTQMKIAGQL